MKNEELIKALRLYAEESPEAKLLNDAADALEATERLLDQNTQRCECLRKQLREAHEYYEKHLAELQAKMDEAENSIKNYKDLYLSRKREELLLTQQIPKNGEWIKHGLGHENVPWGFDCSICKEWFVIDSKFIGRYKYCPNCGAKMDGKEQDDD